MHPHPAHTPHEYKNAPGSERRTNRITQPVSLISQESKTSSAYNDWGQILPSELTTVVFLVQYLGYWPYSYKECNYVIKTMTNSILNNYRTGSNMAYHCCWDLIKIERHDSQSNAKYSGFVSRSEKQHEKMHYGSNQTFKSRYLKE